MASDFKLDINISQKQIQEMAKQVIRDIIQDKIESVLKDIKVEQFVEEKVNSIIDFKASKIIDNTTKKELININRTIEKNIALQVRSIVIEEIQKKPLSGNVYLKIGNADVSTDYDDRW